MLCEDQWTITYKYEQTEVPAIKYNSQINFWHLQYIWPTKVMAITNFQEGKKILVCLNSFTLANWSYESNVTMQGVVGCGHMQAQVSP